MELSAVGTTNSTTPTVANDSTTTATPATTTSNDVEKAIPNVPASSFSVSSFSLPESMGDKKDEGGKRITIFTKKANIGGSAKKEGQQISNVFGEEEEGGLFSRQHRPLTKLEKSRDVTNQKLQAEEEKKRARELTKQLMEKIPNEKEAIFSYQLDWKLIEERDIVRKKIRSRTRQQIAEFLGSEDGLVDTVTDFVLTKLKKRVSASSLVAEVTPFLDRDAEPFVIDLWSNLIHEQLRATSRQ